MAIFDFYTYAEASQAPTVITNSDYTINYVNKKMELLTGFSLEDFRKRVLKDLFSMVENNFILPDGNKETEFPFIVTGSLLTKSSDKIPVTAVIDGLHINNERFYSISFRSRPSENRTAKATPVYQNIHLENNKTNWEADRERYKLAIEASQTGVGEYIFSNKKLVFDESLTSLLGFSEIQFRNLHFLNDLIHPDDREELISSVSQYLKTKKTYFEITFRALHKSRIYLWILCRGKILFNEGEPERIIFSLTDVTEKVESSEQLKNALVKLRSIFQVFPDLFFRISHLGDFLEVIAGNGADLKWKDKKDYEGKNIKEVLPVEAYRVFYETLNKAFESGHIELCEYQTGYPDPIKYFEARIVAVSENEVIAIIRNITESKRASLELMEARKTTEQAISAREEFISTISHEIRTPLNVVIGMTYLLLKNNPRDDQLKYLDTLKFSSDGLINLVNDLLDLSKVKAGKLDFEQIDFDLYEILDHIKKSYDLQFEQRPVEFILEKSHKLPRYINGDPKRLTQILNNLLNNASKFTDSGTIQLIVQPDENSRENIFFSVIDTGKGIHPEKLQVIFEPFQQEDPTTNRKYGGTGLGLAIIKQLVEMQHGTIEVSSVPGKGSTFTVKIPYTIPEAQERNKEEVGEASCSHLGKYKLRVLYADDVASNQFLMQSYFNLWGCDLDQASNGQEAVLKASSREYDIILMDVIMPMMDGYTAAKTIRRKNGINSKTPILAITGDISKKAKKNIRDAGMNDFMVKPIDPALLYDKIIRTILKKEDKSRVAAHPSTPETPVLSDEIIDYRQPDRIFDNVPDQYNQLLDMLIKEFRSNKISLSSAIYEMNLENFREIKHAITSNMKLFQMRKLMKMLDHIKTDFEAGKILENNSNRIHDLEMCMEEVIESLLEKRKALISS